MRAILLFLFRLRLVFLFVVLQTIALVLTINNNAYHRAGFLNSSNRFSGEIYKRIADARYFLRLGEVNDSLAGEISRLQNRLYLLAENDSSIWLLHDSLQAGDARYHFQQARVVNNTYSFRNNYLTLNKGSLQGIRPRMAVVNAGAVVGIVKDVSEHFSTVISVLNKSTRISARHRTSGTTGTVIWPGSNFREASLIEIPIHIELAEGDTITSSEYSNIFPENLLIGTIKSFSKPEGSSTYQVQIALANDFSRMAFVQIIGSKVQEEREALEEGLNYDN
ncbi:MAG: rod shape-determining protein MreC [Bacteroidia bacterium]